MNSVLSLEPAGTQEQMSDRHNAVASVKVQTATIHTNLQRDAEVTKSDMQDYSDHAGIQAASAKSNKRIIGSLLPDLWYRDPEGKIELLNEQQQEVWAFQADEKKKMDREIEEVERCKEDIKRKVHSVLSRL